jgi:hypothetical protein
MAKGTQDRKQAFAKNQNPVDHKQVSIFDEATINAINWADLYGEIWTSIRETDQISFKLLSLVPLVSGSGAGLLVFLFGKQTLGFIPIVCLSILSACVTFGLYRWERRNIDTCERLLERAEWLEKRFGFGNLAGGKEAPRIFGLEIGKTQAEIFIYSASILAWIVPIIVAFNQG